MDYFEIMSNLKFDTKKSIRSTLCARMTTFHKDNSGFVSSDISDQSPSLSLALTQNGMFKYSAQNKLRHERQDSIPASFTSFLRTLHKILKFPWMQNVMAMELARDIVTTSTSACSKS